MVVPTEDLLLKSPTARPLSAQTFRRPKVNSPIIPSGSGYKEDLSVSIQASPKKYSVVRSPVPRFESSGRLDNGATYDLDTKGPKKGLAHATQTSPIKYSNMRTSGRSDTKVKQEASFHKFYNTSRLHKSSIRDSLASSSKTYATMRSPTPRFQSNRVSATPLSPGEYGVVETIRPRTVDTFVARTPRFREERKTVADGFYGEDGVPKPSLSASLAKSSNKYSTMRSKLDRFNNNLGIVDTQLHEHLSHLTGTYDTDNGPNKSLAKSIETEGRPYSACFKSNITRQPLGTDHGDKQLRRALNNLELYQTDTGPKATVATGILKSDNRASVLRNRTSRWAPQMSGTSRDLGPGSYDASAADTVIRPKTVSLPMRNSKRFQEQRSGSHGTVFNLERETKKWFEKSAYISKTARPDIFKIQAVDQAYNTDIGNKMSLAKSIARSPIKYKAISKESKCPRQMDPTVYRFNDTRLIHAAQRQGSANSNTTDPKQPNTSPKEAPTVQEVKPKRPTSTLQSTVPRFWSPQDRELKQALSKLDYRDHKRQTVREDLQRSTLSYSMVRNQIPTQRRRPKRT